MKKLTLQKILKVGLILGLIAGVAGYMHHENRQRVIKLEETIEYMSAEIDTWKSEYNEEVKSNKKIDELVKQQQEWQQKYEKHQQEIIKHQQEIDKRDKELLKKLQSVNNTQDTI